MMKFFGVGAMALAVFGFGTAAAQAKAFTEIKFGVDATYPPFESMLPSGEFVGFDIDLGKAICSTLHVKCVFVAQGFDGIIPALQARKFDAILSSMTVTPDREKQIDFSSEMYNDSTSLVAKKGSGLVPTAASLKGKTVGVESGTIQETYADTYWKPAGVTVRSYPGQDQVYADLLSGRLDASLQDTVEATDGFLNKSEGAPFAAAGNPEYDPQDVLGSYIAIGLRKNETALKAKIDYAIAKIIKDGTYKKLESKYFNFDIYAYTPAK